MGFWSSVKQVAAPVVEVVSEVSNPTAILKPLGLDDTANELTGGVTGKLENVSETLPNLVTGDSVRDNIADAIGLLQSAQNPQGTAKNVATTIIRDATQKQQTRQNIAAPSGSNYYQVPNIQSYLPKSNQEWLIYGAIGLVTYLAISKYKK